MPRLFPLVVSSTMALSPLLGCSANRQIVLSPGPAGVTEYLTSHQHTDLLVTDATGRSRWVHNPVLDGDTVRGLRNRELPRQRVAIPVDQIRSLATPEFSAGRTIGLAVGIVDCLAVTVLILMGGGPQPVH